MNGLFIIGCLTLLLSSLRTSDSLGCYSCQHTDNPASCRAIQQCNAGEKCYVEELVSSAGNIYFNSGCRPSSMCHNKRDTDTTEVAEHKMAKRTDIAVCAQCCDGHYCNLHLCSSSANGKPLVNRTFCASCSGVVSPGDCDIVKPCDVDETCYTELIHINGEDRYRLGCTKQASCSREAPSLLGRKRFLLNQGVSTFGPYCAKCCSGQSNCNIDMCGVNMQSAESNIQVLQLDNPPLRLDKCSDVDENQCRGMLTTQPDACKESSVANYMCRRSCTCGGSGNSHHVKDCFFKSTTYAGTYKSTISGKTCIPWTSFSSLSHTGPGFPETSIANADNKCRDPTGKGFPWCYTSITGDWEYCSVPFCEECYYRGHVSQFNGFISHDKLNRSCLPWTISNGLFPLRDSMFVDGSVANASNYCRDPFNTGQLICFEGESVFKECGVKECPGQCEDDVNTQCSLLKSYVCSSEFTRKILCPKTCGDCNAGLLPAKWIPPPPTDAQTTPTATSTVTSTHTTVTFTTPSTTSSYVWSQWSSWSCHTVGTQCFMTRFRTCSTGRDVDCVGQNSELLPCTINICSTQTTCQDFLNCTNLKSHICLDAVLSVEYCRRSCNKCHEPVVPVHLNECGDPTTSGVCQVLNNELCMCADPGVRQLCQNFCDGRCKLQPVTPPSCTSAKFGP